MTPLYQFVYISLVPKFSTDIKANSEVTQSNQNVGVPITLSVVKLLVSRFVDRPV